MFLKLYYHLRLYVPKLSQRLWPGDMVKRHFLNGIRLLTCTGHILSLMWLAVNRLLTLASLWRRWSSNPNKGAGRTMVVSGNIRRTTCSPLAYRDLTFFPYGRKHWHTFVRKNSEGDLLSALYEETWIKRSTSYLATASAIRSAPSTWTSVKVKFLRKPNQQNFLHLWKANFVLCGIVPPDQINNHVWMADTLLQRRCIS